MQKDSLKSYIRAIVSSSPKLHEMLGMAPNIDAVRLDQKLYAEMVQNQCS